MGGMRQVWADNHRVVVAFDGGAVCAYDDELRLTHWYDGPAAGCSAAWERLTGRRPPRREQPVGEAVLLERRRFVHHGDAVMVSGVTGQQVWIAEPTDADYEGWDAVAASLVVRPVSWSGPAGEWTVQARLWNAGADRTGVTLSIAPNPLVTLDRGVFDGVEARTARAEGTLSFAGVSLERNRPVTLVLSGRAVGSSALRLRASSRRHQIVAGTRPDITRTEVDEVVLGEIVVQIGVEAAKLRLVRGEQAVGLDGAWVAALSTAGALDAEARPPDLGRWLVRALARCRVSAPEQDPDAVLAEWSRMSERDRSATGGGKIPAYKLASGQGWVVSGAELARIGAALGPEHPLSQFAAGGPFEVVGDTPPYSATST